MTERRSAHTIAQQALEAAHIATVHFDNDPLQRASRRVAINFYMKGVADAFREVGRESTATAVEEARKCWLENERLAYPA